MNEYKLNQRISHLKKIKRAIFMSRRGSLSPALLPILVVTTIAGLITYWISSFLQFQIQPFGILVGILASVVIGYWLAKHKTWNGLIFDLVATYRPMNADAYRHIQQLAESKNLSFEDILEWVRVEEEALPLPRKKESKPSEEDLARERLVKRKLNF